MIDAGTGASERSRISASALRHMDVEYDEGQRQLLGQTLAELARRPGIGTTIDVEYSGTDVHTAPICKFFSPPCDILYAADPNDGIIVYGFVRSVDSGE